MPSNLALERLSETRAIGNAIAIHFGKPGAALPEQLLNDQRDAFLRE